MATELNKQFSVSAQLFTSLRPLGSSSVTSGSLQVSAPPCAARAKATSPEQETSMLTQD